MRPRHGRGAVAAEFGGDVATDPLAAIARADVDAVLIASPDDTHADLTIAAVRAGKPVLCESPSRQIPRLTVCRTAPG